MTWSPAVQEDLKQAFEGAPQAYLAGQGQRECRQGGRERKQDGMFHKTVQRALWGSRVDVRAINDDV
jgi:hypothetical protein